MPYFDLIPRNQSLGQAITAILVSLVSIIYYKTKPFPIPSSLPGPKRYPWLGFLWHPIKYWDIWPTETTRLAKLYKRTWGGPLPRFGAMPGAYFYIHDENNIRHVLKDNFHAYLDYHKESAVYDL